MLTTDKTDTKRQTLKLVMIIFQLYQIIHFLILMLSAWAATSASSSSHSYFPASKVQPNNSLLYCIVWWLCVFWKHQKHSRIKTQIFSKKKRRLKIYFKPSHSSHVLGRFIKLGKVCNWQGSEIPVFYGKFNLSLYSSDSEAELSGEKFNLVLFPDDKMRSEPVTSSHCGHPEMWGIDKKSGSCEKSLPNWWKS